MPAGNPFAFNNDLSKFDIGRIFVRQKVTLNCHYPSSADGFKDYDVGIPMTPSGLDNYAYRPVAVVQASNPSTGGVYLSGFSIDSAFSVNPVAAYIAFNTGSSVTNSGYVNIDAFVFYVRTDIIKTVS